MKIAFLVKPEGPGQGSHLSEAARLLVDRGVTVDLIYVSERLIDPATVRVEHDLYVLKDKGDLALSVAASLHQLGAPVLNPYPASAMLRDKIVTFQVLQAAGVPTPQVFVASHVEQLRPAAEQGPLIVKPYRKARGRGVHIVRDPSELAQLPPVGEPVFAQRYHPPKGRDRKIFAIGGELYGVKRVWPPETLDDKVGERFTPSAELAEIAWRCGEAFGIDLFGVDIIESDGRAYVVNMASVPGFKGVPDAAHHLARYIYEAAGRVRSGGSVAAPVRRGPGGSPAARSPVTGVATHPGTPGEEGRRCRVALYSQGMIGFGHIRRNATIAHALRASTLEPTIVMIAEAWQAGAIPMPSGVDCVTLPGLRKEADGACYPRFLDVSDQDLIALRAKVIRSAIKEFRPDVLIVDHLPLGAARELTRTLERLRRGGNTRCVLGLRDVLQDRAWADPANIDAMRDYYDAIWVYGDAAVYDPLRDYGLGEDLTARVRYAGYLDQRPRLDFGGTEAAALLASLPPGRLALCMVGGGRDGADLAEAFVEAELPADAIGLVVTGPYMPEELRDRLRRRAEQRPRVQVVEFVAEPAALIDRADRIIGMAGYNTMCEVLSFEKHALIVPRVNPEPEQWIRASRMGELGLIDVLHPDALTPAALTEWLARDLGPAPASRSRIDVAGLGRIPGLLEDLLGVAAATP